MENINTVNPSAPTANSASTRKHSHSGLIKKKVLSYPCCFSAPAQLRQCVRALGSGALFAPVPVAARAPQPVLQPRFWSRSSSSRRTQPWMMRATLDKEEVSTRCMQVDPRALPWSAWPAWNQTGSVAGWWEAQHMNPPCNASRQADNVGPSVVHPFDHAASQQQQLGFASEAANEQIQSALPTHILSDQPLLQASAGLPCDDANMATLRAAAEMLRAGNTVAIPTVSTCVCVC